MPASITSMFSGRPRYLRARSSPAYTIFVSSYAVFVDLFLYGIIVPVFPFALVSRIGIHPSSVQHWVSILLTVYGCSLLAFSLFVGWWSDRTATRRVPFYLGLLLLAASTVLLMLARSIAVLLVARILQGASAAIVWTVSTAVMTDRIGTKNLGQAMGWITIARSVSVLIAPIVGGIVYERAGYYAVYGVCFGFIFWDFVFRLLLVEARVAQKWDPSIRPEEEEERPATAASLEAEKAPEARPSTPNETTQAPSLLHRITYRLPAQITLFAHPRVVVGLWGIFWQALLICGFDAVIPLFVRHTFHWKSSGAGLIFLAVVIPTFISPAIGWLSDRHGPKWFCVFGYLACTPPLVLLRLVDGDDLRQKVLLAALLALVGGLIMFFEIPLWVEIIKVAEEMTKRDPGRYGDRAGAASGQAYSLFNVFYSIGLIVGPIWTGYLYQQAGWGTMAWTLGLVSAVSAAPTVLWTGGWIFEKRGEAVCQVEEVHGSELDERGLGTEADAEDSVKAGETRTGLPDLDIGQAEPP